MQSDTTIVKKANRRVLLTVILFGLVVLALLAWVFMHRMNFEKERLDINYADVAHPVVLQGDISLSVFTADDPAERAMGLSSFDTLEEDEAMLFIFDYPGRYPFWMKDMKFAIDIVWLDVSGVIVYIKENAEPSDYPNAYYPDTDALYVIEFVSGFVEKQNIQIGDTLRDIIETQ